ncbi:MAG: hypothetical protein ACP5OY_07820 [Halothiobacillaceae bacterium]|jgi:hypothetical protein
MRLIAPHRWDVTPAEAVAVLDMPLPAPIRAAHRLASDTGLLRPGMVVR